MLKGGENDDVMMEIFFLHNQVYFLRQWMITCKLDAHKLNLEKASHIWGEFTNFQSSTFEEELQNYT